MRRCEEREVLDGNGVDDGAIVRAYREIHSVHRFLGTTGALLRLLSEESEDGHGASSKIRVLDIGCGQGAMLELIRTRLGFECVGFDLRPAPRNSYPIPIFAGNAVYDSLPFAEVAICVMMAHHLSPDELEKMIGNVSRTCRRFVIIDLVRHPMPLRLFQIFLCPFLSRLNAIDGQTSIRRAYTASEMRDIVQRAVRNTSIPIRSLRHSVAPFWIRQVVDIRWEEARRDARAAVDGMGAESELTSAPLRS